jgi:ferric-dicitrate binding protein FerR (iron transport regulator)
MTKQDPLQELFEKFLNDKKMTAAEIRQLRNLVQHPQQQQALDQLLSVLYEEETTGHLTAETNAHAAFEEVWARLQATAPSITGATSLSTGAAQQASLATIDTFSTTSSTPAPIGLTGTPDTSPEVPVVALHVRRPWWKYAAAAAILLTAAAGTWLVLRTKQPPAIIVQQQPQPVKDILPGGQHATLTLGDGTAVSLDTARNGTLVQQGNTRVVKLANGQLAYEAASNIPVATVLYNTISTPRGGKFHITLPDGTGVWLNAMSSLRYPAAFRGASREVTLTGEAYFEVAKNKAMPFQVKVGDMQVEVLGTHFNIMAYTDEEAINTTLLEGKVKVMNTAAAQTNAPSTVQPGTPGAKVLNPGQQASLRRSNGAIAIQSEVNTEAAIAWKNELIQLEGSDIHTVMRTLARWYDVEIEYRGNVPAVHFRGMLPANIPVSQVLGLMEQTGEVHFVVSGRKIIVTP